MPSKFSRWQHPAAGRGARSVVPGSGTTCTDNLYNGWWCDVVAVPRWLITWRRITWHRRRRHRRPRGPRVPRTDCVLAPPLACHRPSISGRVAAGAFHARLTSVWSLDDRIHSHDVIAPILTAYTDYRHDADDDDDDAPENLDIRQNLDLHRCIPCRCQKLDVFKCRFSHILARSRSDAARGGYVVWRLRLIQRSGRTPAWLSPGWIARPRTPRVPPCCDNLEDFFSIRHVDVSGDLRIKRREGGAHVGCVVQR